MVRSKNISLIYSQSSKEMLLLVKEAGSSNIEEETFQDDKKLPFVYPLKPRTLKIVPILPV